MIDVSQTAIFVLYLVSLVLGFCLAVAYDLTAIMPALCGRVFSAELRARLYAKSLPLIGKLGSPFAGRRVGALTGFALFLHDTVFFALSGAATALAVYCFGDGVFRFGVPIFLISGICLYRMAPRRGVLALAELVFFALRCTVAYAVFFTVTPAVRLCKRVNRRIAHACFLRRVRRYMKKEYDTVRRADRTGLLNIKIKVSEEVRNGGRRKKQKASDDMDDGPSSRRGIGDIVR